jgi:hypothetical protein
LVSALGRFHSHLDEDADPERGHDRLGGPAAGQPAWRADPEDLSILDGRDFTLIDKRKHLMDSRGHYNRPESRVV